MRRILPAIEKSQRAMSFGLADFAAAGYLAWGTRKGWRRGLSIELPRLASVTLALVTGAFYLARQFRAWMGRWITSLLPEETMQKRAGMAAGFLRTLVISSIITICLLHTPLAFLMRDSMMGDLAKIVQPVYHIAAKPHP